MKNEENILQQRNIKPTAMRLLVAEKLLKQQYAVSHKEFLLLWITTLLQRARCVESGGYNTRKINS